MADQLSARQHIVDKIKESSNILVTVGQNPSVDELSAALGLTLMLNKLNKHATAVVSGDIPPAITFLDPEKIFENSVNSLRDFIIALDKEKADHLRYKVDGDVVKIFITPYRTTIDEKDLDFSQGDYNVELVLALGAKDEAHLDQALEAHGKILHDATVATISAGSEPSDLGSIDWRDDTASSLSEMLVSLSEAIKGSKAVLDEQISTALLTGIVAATNRFSNEKTSSKVMTMAAQLMAAGANQQLIATKLEEAQEIGVDKTDQDSDQTSQNADGTTDIGETSSKIDKSSKAKTEEDNQEKSAVGTLAISHEKKGDLDEVAEQTARENTNEAADKANDALEAVAQETAQAQAEEAARAAERKLAEELSATVPAANQTEPLMGGTLNATSEQAAEDKRREEESDRNKTILSHNRPQAKSLGEPSPLNAAVQSAAEESPVSDPFAATTPTQPAQSVEPISVPEPTPAAPAVADQSLADLDAQVRHPEHEARSAVDAAFGTTPEPTTTPVVPFELPPMPDFSTLPPLPPLPDFGPVSSPQPTTQNPATQPAPVLAEPEFIATPLPNDPGQFKIPGQS